MNMAPFIAMMIIRARKVSVESGQAKYRAYFINTALYVQFQEDVNTILTTDGLDDCIVTV